MTTKIFALIDASGSMNHLRTDVVGGVNAFIEEQQANDRLDDAEITISFFDSKYGADGEGLRLETVRDAEDVMTVALLDVSEYRPNGGTPLLDAMGTTLASIKSTANDQVIFLVYTDGAENASTEYSNDTLKALVTDRTDNEGYIFSYLGANQDAFSVAAQYGFSKGNTQNFGANKKGTSGAMSTTSSLVNNVRSMRNAGLTYDNTNAYASTGTQTIDGAKVTESTNLFDNDKTAGSTKLDEDED